MRTAPNQPPAAARPRQKIRSYVLRPGRITAGQQRALKTLWPKYGLTIPAEGGLDYAQIFSPRAAPPSPPLHLEIGCGDGEALVEMAQQNPQEYFLGAEVHTPGVGRLLLQIEARGLQNVRIFCADGMQVLTQAIAPNSLAALHLYFPDPWPKKRHHKRRLLQPEFIKNFVSRLQLGGDFYFATDWQPYAEYAQEILAQSPALQIHTARGKFIRPPTKFERRGRRLGHKIWDISAQRIL